MHTKRYIEGIRGISPTSAQMLTIGSDGQLGSQTVPTATVAGPGSRTDTAIVRWNGTTGTAIQDSSITIDSNGYLTLPSTNQIKCLTGLLAHSTGAGSTFFGITAGNATEKEGDQHQEARTYPRRRGGRRNPHKQGTNVADN